MKIVRVIDNQIIELQPNNQFIDNRGFKHPWNIVQNWSEDELNRWLSIYRLDDNIKIPKDMQLVGPVSVVLENGIPKLDYKLAQIVPPEISDHPIIAEPSAVKIVYIDQSAMIPDPPEPPPLPPDPEPPIEPEPVQDPTTVQDPIIVQDPSIFFLKTLENIGLDPTEEQLQAAKILTHTDATMTPLVAYGGIVFRTLTLAKKGDYHQGHRHNYNHITNLVSGSVLCEVENGKPMVFKAPTQITIAAEDWHKFTALEDNTVYQCVYRQPEGKITDIYQPENDPYGTVQFTKEELLHKISLIDAPCAHCDCDKNDGDIEQNVETTEPTSSALD